MFLRKLIYARTFVCNTVARWWQYGKRFAIIRYAILLVLRAVSLFAEFKSGKDPEIEDAISKEDPRTAADSISGVVQSNKLNIEEEDDEFISNEYIIENTDPQYCEYDSTWETSTSTSQSLPTDHRSVPNYTFVRFQNAARDMQNYRQNYPGRGKEKQVDSMPNLEFYLGKRPSAPDGIYINEFHKAWNGEYLRLERVHTYIQWLFPLQEPGVNYEARELSKAEIKHFLESEEAKSNLQKSYKLMLGFYGIILYDEATGKVTKAQNWQSRFNNLNRNTHNNLRITRILKCLGTLGFLHYQAPLVRFFLEETLVHGNLQNVKESVLNYFLFTVHNRKQRRNLIKFAYLNYEPKDEFVWCPKKIQKIWSKAQALPASQPLNMRAAKEGTASPSASVKAQWSKWGEDEMEYEAGKKVSPCDPGGH